ncbi:Ku protein [Proteinivorax hydrogeniformans]|uniref:Non-homologous end joining protein Ku n=1 Tax=Proteinivorax hydrogeniformans TaxID=1826727 RepID=A0AAU8HX58_9FIRM
MWKGAVSFGLVNVPIKMFTATENKSVKFRNLHKDCNTPIKYQRVCPNCEREVESEEIVRGYEYQKGTFVVINDEDIEAIPNENTKSIDIMDFVNLKDIDPVFFDKTYYLAPEETGKKAYNLLTEALSKTKRVAVAKVVIRSKESLVAIRVYKGTLVLETMHFPDEVRNVKEVPGVGEKVKVSDNELDMAKELIEKLSAKFDPEKYTDEYRNQLMSLIEQKVQGKEIAQPKAKRDDSVVDLMEALESSLNAVKKEAVTSSNKKKPRKKKTG